MHLKSPRREAPRRTLGLTFLLLTTAALLLGAGWLTLSGCSGGEAADTATTQLPTVTDIGPDQLAEMLKNKDFILINTHVPYAGEIEQTDLFIDYEQAAARVSELPADKSAKIVAYCQSDRMSTIAAKAWAQAGYTNLYNLSGGFLAWEAAGYELLQKPQ